MLREHPAARRSRNYPLRSGLPYTGPKIRTQSFPIPHTFVLQKKLFSSQALPGYELSLANKKHTISHVDKPAISNPPGSHQPPAILQLQRIVMGKHLERRHAFHTAQHFGPNFHIRVPRQLKRTTTPLAADTTVLATVPGPASTATPARAEDPIIRLPPRRCRPHRHRDEPLPQPGWASS